MKKFGLSTLLALSIITGSSRLLADSVITLDDGSQIKGNVVQMQNGIYTVETSAMGTLQISSEKVANIGREGAVPPPAAAPSAPLTAAASPEFNQKMQAAQAQIMGNPEIMQDVQNMMQDPELMELFSDPSIMRAVMAKDPQALAGNPRARELMENPKMRALIEKLQNSQ